MDETTPADETPTEAPAATTVADDAAEVDDELLLEEVSIDGMCGVY